MRTNSWGFFESALSATDLVSLTQWQLVLCFGWGSSVLTVSMLTSGRASLWLTQSQRGTFSFVLLSCLLAHLFVRFPRYVQLKFLYYYFYPLLLCDLQYCFILQFLSTFNIQGLSQQCYYRHQAKLLIPTINWQWKLDQEERITEAVGLGAVTLGGDMRADSPGSCLQKTMF